MEVMQTGPVRGKSIKRKADMFPLSPFKEMVELLKQFNHFPPLPNTLPHTPWEMYWNNKLELNGHLVRTIGRHCHFSDTPLICL